jgi:hypothetical protein
MFGKNKKLGPTDGLKNVTLHVGYNVKTEESMPPVPEGVFQTTIAKITGMNAHLGSSLKMYHEHVGIKTTVAPRLPKPSELKEIERYVKKVCKAYPNAADYAAFGDMFATYIYIIEYGVRMA